MLTGTFVNCRAASNSGHPSLYPLFPTPSHQRAFSAAAAGKKRREMKNINPFSHPAPFSRSNAQENTQRKKENNFPGKRKGATPPTFAEKKAKEREIEERIGNLRTILARMREKADTHKLERGID